MEQHRVIKPQETTLFSAQAATGVSGAIDVADSRHICVAVSATLNSTLTFKFQGSVRQTVPTFSSAQAVDNVWDYIEVYDMQDSSSAITGDTGVALNNDTVANNTRQYLINTDYISWFSLEVSSYTDGALSAWIVGVND